MNRIIQASESYKKKISELTPEKREFLEKQNDLTWREIATFQEKKSLAQLEGIISLEEAMTIYNALNSWATVPLELKVAIYLSMGEIIKIQQKRR